MKPQSNFLVFLASACSLASPTIHAATNTWSTTPSDGLWATTGNWSLNALATSDNIVFGTSTVTTLATVSRTIADLTFNSGAPGYNIFGTSAGQVLTLSSSGGGIKNNSSSVQVINTDLILSSTPANFTLATAGANNGSLILNGNYNFNGTPSNQNITLAFGSTTGSTITFNGNLVNTGSGGSGLFLTGGSGNNLAVLAGNNTGLNAVYMPTSSLTTKLASTGAVASFATVNGGSSTGTLWLASDTAINTFGLSYAGVSNTAAKNTVILDRATTGAALTSQYLASLELGKQTTTTFRKGANVTSGTTLLTVFGTTTFGESGGGNVSILTASDVNLSLGNVSAKTGSTSGLNSGIVLDGNTTGSTVTGVISNGAGTGTVTNTVSSSTGQTITLTSATGFAQGMTISGTGIAAGTVITNVNGAILTLSQATSSPTGTITGTAVNASNLYKAGSGTWSLTGANTYTGVTSVNGGILKLDFANSSTTTDILYNSFVTSGTGTRPTTAIGGGTLLLTGKAGTNNVQNLGQIRSQLNFPGSGNVTLVAGSGGTMTVNATTIGSGVNTALNFNIDANSILNFSGATASTMAGPRVFINGNDFARYDASKNLIASGTNGYNNSGIAITGSTAMTLNNSSYWIINGDLSGANARSGITSFRGLKITSSGGTNQSLDLGGFTASARDGGVLYTGGGTNTYNIKNGTLSVEGGSAEILFNVVSGATLNIDSTVAVTDNGSFITTIGQAGNGNFVVSGAKSFTGKSYVNAGNYSFDTIASGGINSGLGASTNAATNLYIGGTLKYTGGVGSTDRSFTVVGTGATIDASGSGALTWAPGSALGFLQSTNSSTTTTAAQNQSITFSGTSNDNNTFGSGSGLLADPAQGLLSITKSGTGKWILNGANTYTGSTFVNGGTLTAGVASVADTSGAFGKNSAVIMADVSGTVLDITGFNTQIGSLSGGGATGGNVTLGSATLTVGGDNTSPAAYGGSISGGGAVTKIGSGTQIFSGSSTYAGATSVNLGKLVVSGSITNSAVTVSNAGTVLATGATGTIGSSLSINSGAILSPGDAGGAGTATVNGATTFNNGSIFSWDISSNGSTYDKLVSSGGLVDGGTAGGAVFQIVAADSSFSNAFWNSTQSWTNIFTTDGSAAINNWAAIFTSVSVVNSNLGAISPVNGAFTVSGSTLTWTAVPEPTSALAGLLITAGLLRRRRKA